MLVSCKRFNIYLGHNLAPRHDPAFHCLPFGRGRNLVFAFVRVLFASSIYSCISFEITSFTSKWRSV